ncbi:MAG: hypothetical protein BJG00_000750 [Limnothrix sp. CACIAM 69d]|nr:MAG: hypothetical protein BJG00_000750 [Limnothrix sp. CACIAM 69d]
MKEAIENLEPPESRILSPLRGFLLKNRFDDWRVTRMIKMKSVDVLGDECLDLINQLTRRIFLKN